MSNKRRSQDESIGPSPKKRKKNNGNRSDIKSLPRFLQHIWSMLHDESLKNIISWHETMPNAFVVHKQNLFCAEILPKYFKHNKFTSFVRQLNMYQFHKLRDEKPCSWSHPYFVKNNKLLLQNIQRRISSSSHSNNNGNNHHGNNSHTNTNCSSYHDAAGCCTCSNDGNNKNILNKLKESNLKIHELENQIKQIRDDTNKQIEILRNEISKNIIKNNKDEIITNNNGNNSSGITTMRHAPPPIKRETSIQSDTDNTTSNQFTQILPKFDLISSSGDSNNNNNINNNNNPILLQQQQQQQQHQQLQQQHQQQQHQQQQQVVYVTSGAAQNILNKSPYIFTPGASPSSHTITLLNLANNLNSRTPPSLLYNSTNNQLISPHTPYQLNQLNQLNQLTNQYQSQQSNILHNMVQ